MGTKHIVGGCMLTFDLFDKPELTLRVGQRKLLRVTTGSRQWFFSGIHIQQQVFNRMTDVRHPAGSVHAMLVG